MIPKTCFCWTKTWAAVEITRRRRLVIDGNQLNLAAVNTPCCVLSFYPRQRPLRGVHLIRRSHPRQRGNQAHLDRRRRYPGGARSIRPRDPPVVVVAPAAVEPGPAAVVLGVLLPLLDPHTASNRLPTMTDVAATFVRCFIVQSPINLEVTATNSCEVILYIQSSDQDTSP